MHKKWDLLRIKRNQNFKTDLWNNDILTFNSKNLGHKLGILGIMNHLRFKTSNHSLMDLKGHGHAKKFYSTSYIDNDMTSNVYQL